MMAKAKYSKKQKAANKSKKVGTKKFQRDETVSNCSTSQLEETVKDTIFIRNLSFETEEDSLKEFIEENFGETVYCLICRDKETDESKGTAFAKFKDPACAEKCLKESRDKDLMTKFHLDGRNLIVLPALSREKVSEIKKTDVKKDKRNLILAKEGFLHPNSNEIAEISKADREKRKALDSRKRELLKNLHNFVSDTRLCIHNLPQSVDDEKLRQIFHNQISDNFTEAKIVECRVMRNKKGSGQLGTSKGFGFVAFSKHEHALAALRALNNNGSIFTKDKRPIVEFSIENLVALNKKKTRLVNSQRKNEAIKSNTESKTKPKSSKAVLKKMKKKSSVSITNIDSNEEANLLKKINKIRMNKQKNKEAF